MKNPEFKFKEKRTTTVFTLHQIIEESKPVLFVNHSKDDGSWQFLSGDFFKPNDVTAVSLQEIVEKDETLNDLADLPRGWQASRGAVTEEWLRVKVTGMQ
jgi:hypothetical protein